MPSTPENVQFIQVGPHRVDIELPDILHVHLNGDVEVEHFQAFYDAIVAFPTPNMIYVLRDARNGGLVSARARKHIAQNIKTARVAALVTYGSSFRARTVLSMMNRALRFINTKIPPTTFFDTESEARAWIAAHRNEPR